MTSPRTSATRYRLPATTMRSSSVERSRACAKAAIPLGCSKATPPCRRTASATSWAGTALGDWGAQQWNSVKPSSTKGVTMSSMSRPVSIPTTQRRAPWTKKAPSRVAHKARTPAGLCAPSTTIMGFRAINSMRPGIRAARNVECTTSPPSARPRNASAATIAVAAFIPWWIPCKDTSTSS